MMAINEDALKVLLLEILKKSGVGYVHMRGSWHEKLEAVFSEEKE